MLTKPAIIFVWSIILCHIVYNNVSAGPLKLLEWLTNDKTVEKHLHIDEYLPRTPLYNRHCPSLVKEYIEFLSDPKTRVFHARAAQMMKLVDQMFTMKIIENPKEVKCDPAKNFASEWKSGFISPCGLVDIELEKDYTKSVNVFERNRYNESDYYKFHKFLVETNQDMVKNNVGQMAINCGTSHDTEHGKFDEYKIAYLEGYRKILDAILFLFAYEYNRLKHISDKEVEEQIDKGILKYRGETYLPKAHALDPSNREKIRKSELDLLFNEFERITHRVLYLECIVHYGNKPDEKVDRDAECRQKTCKPMRVNEKQQSLWEGWFCPTII